MNEKRQLPLSPIRNESLVRTGRLSAVVFSFAILGCIFLIATDGLTAREAGLLSILLAIFSILATWIVGHVYSSETNRKSILEVQEFYRTNLRMYALKAAEKVTNLSNELERLAAYLEQELENTDHESAADALSSREERLVSAVHLINTLKSVNDTALSDWEGVIGDELDEQREERREREAELRELIDRFDDLVVAQAEIPVPTSSEAEKLRKEVRGLTRNLAEVTREFVGSRYVGKPRREKAKKQGVESTCPACGEMVSYKQRPMKTSIKPLPCSSCGVRLFSIYRPEEGFSLQKREIREEQIECPNCSADIEVFLDTFPNTSAEVECYDCGAIVRATRKTEDVRVVIGKASAKPDNEASRDQIEAREMAQRSISAQLMERVRSELPPQPWPRGTHRAIAKKLGVDTTLVWECIDKLMKNGGFMLQVDGRLFVPIEDREATPPPVSGPNTTEEGGEGIEQSDSEKDGTEEAKIDA